MAGGPPQQAGQAACSKGEIIFTTLFTSVAYNK
jgi:hypothetical protein